MDNRNPYTPPRSDLEKPRFRADDLASRGARLAGAIIDSVIALAVMLPLMRMSGYWDKVLAEEDTLLDVFTFTVLGMLMFFLIHGFLLSRYGQTVGKRVMGTKIVSVETNEILPLWHVFLLRYAAPGFISQLGLLGQLFAVANALFIFRADHRCIHDHFAGTRVVYADTPEGPGRSDRSGDEGLASSATAQSEDGDTRE